MESIVVEFKLLKEKSALRAGRKSLDVKARDSKVTVPQSSSSKVLYQKALRGHKWGIIAAEEEVFLFSFNQSHFQFQYVGAEVFHSHIYPLKVQHVV